MLKLFTKVLFITYMSLSLQACAESPDRLITSRDQIGGIQPVLGQAIKTNAVHYSGLDFDDNPCDVFITFHDGKWMMQSSLQVHGQKIPDVTLGEYDYDSASKNYGPLNASGIVNQATLATALLNNPALPVDLNKISDYRQSGDLAYAYRVDLSSNLTFAEFEAFEDAMKEIEADATKYTTFENDIMVLSQVRYTVGHLGHYDPGACLNLTAQGVDEIEFIPSAGGPSDDHDHDHDQP